MWVPAFKVEQSQANTGAIEGLQLDKNDQNSFVKQASQTCSVELFTMPASDGTPMCTPDYPAVESANLGLIADSFVFVVNQQSLDESLDMPLALVHVDRQTHWKRL